MALRTNDHQKLRNAFLKHDLNKAKQVLSEGVSINTASPGGNTSLHWSVENDYVEGVYFCLDNGAYIDAQNNEQNTPLHRAVCKSNACLVRLLVDNGANLEATIRNGYTPLHISASDEIVGILLDYGAELYSVSKYGQFPMQTALGTGQVELIKRHLANNGKLDDRFNNEETLLFFAGNEARIFLLTQGANVNVQDKSGKTLLLLAVGRGDTAIIQQLFTAGADVNISDWWSSTPLMDAVGRGNITVIQQLLDAGANVNTWNKGGETPLHIAMKSNYTMEAWKEGVTAIDFKMKIVQTLLKAGADVSANKPFPKLDGSILEYSPLHLAVEYTDAETVKVLLEHGAKVNLRDRSRNTPLHKAARVCREDTEIIRLLIAHGANVNAVNDCRDTPLRAAYDAKSREAIQFLVANGAEIDRLSKEAQRYIRLLLDEQTQSTQLP